MFVNTDSKVIWKNGSFEKWEDASVHLLSHTMHYGTGVFEGVRAYKTDQGAAIFRLKIIQIDYLKLHLSLVLKSHIHVMS